MKLDTVPLLVIKQQFSTLRFLFPAWFAGCTPPPPKHMPHNDWSDNDWSDESCARSAHHARGVQMPGVYNPCQNRDVPACGALQPG